MTNEELQKLKELAQAATPGPWTHRKHGVIVAGPFIDYTNGSAQSQIASFGVTDIEHGEPERQLENSDFCAAANPEAVLELIALAERATQPAQPCGGCGNADPDKRCIGCGHEFTPALAQDRCCDHDSDCAVHNAPAYPVGPCDCTLSEKPAQDQVAAVRAVLEGWKLVPEQATEAMYHAGQDVPEPRTFGAVYSAMLAAAPSPQPEQSGSIDSIKLIHLLNAYVNAPFGKDNVPYKAIVTHIDQWTDAACAVAREEGKREVVADAVGKQGVILQRMQDAERRATDAEAKLAAIRDGLDKLTTYNPGIQWGVKNWQGGLVLISKNEVRAMLAQRTASPSQSDTNGLPG